MSLSQWTSVDAYMAEQLLAGDAAVFAEILAANAAAGLPAIDVSPTQGKLLNLLVKITGARRVLEVGTLGGYSTVWMATALPEGGELVTLEFNAEHAAVARKNFARAGLADRVRLIEGAALDSLPTLTGPFDFVFIDADKPNNVGYLEHAVRLARPGTVIVLDNVVRDGRVVDARSTDGSVIGSRAAFDFLKTHRRIDATALQTVGPKGWDGFVLARVSA